MNDLNSTNHPSLYESEVVFLRVNHQKPIMAALTASFFSGVRPLPLAVLILSFLASHIQAQDQDSPTTVPIFLPAYSKTELWSSLRGSVITSVRPFALSVYNTMNAN